jgi:hypothetical protein
MLFLSAAVLLLLTLYAGWSARLLRLHGDPAGYRQAYLVAAVCGAIGTICTFIAAVI